MPGRTIAMGDIHGCSRALATVLAAIELTPQDELIVLGDFIDRGPDSRGAIDQLLELAGRCRLVHLLGNHEEMYLAARDAVTSGSAAPRAADVPATAAPMIPPNYDPARQALHYWLKYGGAATLDSYGPRTAPHELPAAHIEFMERALPFYENETHAFLHANYDANVPLEAQSAFHLRWESLRDRIPPRHISGKTIILGHTPQPEGQILDREYLKCIDTGCYNAGWLTALDVATGRLWQANQQGELRPA